MQAEDLEASVEVKQVGEDSAVPTTPQEPTPMESEELGRRRRGGAVSHRATRKV